MRKTTDVKALDSLIQNVDFQSQKDVVSFVVALLANANDILQINIDEAPADFDASSYEIAQQHVSDAIRAILTKPK